MQRYMLIKGVPGYCVQIPKGGWNAYYGKRARVFKDGEVPTVPADRFDDVVQVIPLTRDTHAHVLKSIRPKMRRVKDKGGKVTYAPKAMLLCLGYEKLSGADEKANEEAKKAGKPVKAPKPYVFIAANAAKAREHFKEKFPDHFKEPPKPESGGKGDNNDSGSGAGSKE